VLCSRCIANLSDSNQQELTAAAHFIKSIQFRSICCVIKRMISLPLLLPIVALVYVIYYFWGPVQPKKSPLRSIEVNSSSRNESAKRRNYLFRNELRTQPGPDITTVDQQFAAAVEKHGSRPALGVRKTVKTEEKKQKVIQEGKEVEKTMKIPYQTPYQWRTYNDCAAEVDKIVGGLASFGLKPQHEKIGLFAGTRPEWQLSCQACFKGGYPAVTVYPSLGADALFFALDQTKVSVLVTQASLMKIVTEAAAKLPSLKYIVYFDDLQQQPRLNGIKAISYEELLSIGEKHRSGNRVNAHVSKPEDLAVIMFTR
jgi:long-chain acyl-CoA synthetase